LQLNCKKQQKVIKEYLYFRRELWKKGLSIIEISIVIVILGILSTISYKGIGILRTAKLQQTIKEFSNFKLKINTFRNIYHFLPGDLPYASEVFVDDSLVQSSHYDEKINSIYHKCQMISSKKFGMKLKTESTTNKTNIKCGKGYINTEARLITNLNIDGVDGNGDGIIGAKEDTYGGLFNKSSWYYSPDENHLPIEEKTVIIATSENYLSWCHLYLSNMEIQPKQLILLNSCTVNKFVNQLYDGKTLGKYFEFIPNKQIPGSKAYKQGAFILHNGQYTVSTVNINLPNTNWVALVGIDTSTGSIFNTSINSDHQFIPDLPVMSSIEAFNIDNKIDDGMPGTGNIIGGNSELAAKKAQGKNCFINKVKTNTNDQNSRYTKGKDGHIKTCNIRYCLDCHW
jgi:prepilin-type N-terminal cleavage/methylation domain-containing protein